MYDETSEGGQSTALVETPSFTSGIALIEVDGERVNPFQSHSVEVLSGTHSFHIWLQDRQFGEIVHVLWPAISATVGSDYYCAKFEALVEPGRTYQIKPSNHGLFLQSDLGDITTRITALNPVPFGNILTSTPTDCNPAGSESHEKHGESATAITSTSEIKKSNMAPSISEAGRTSSVCSNAQNLSKPWVGNWVAREHEAVLTFEIEEEVVRGVLKSGSKDFYILGRVDDNGAIDASIFGRGSWSRMDVRGTFPNVQLTYPYGTPPAEAAVFKVLNGRTIHLCS